MSPQSIQLIYTLFGYEPRISIESDYSNMDEKVRARHDIIRANSEIMKRKQEETYNKSASKVRSLGVGDNVAVRKFGHTSALEQIYEPSKVW